MNSDTFKLIVERHLLPMFSGACIDKIEQPNKSTKLVVLVENQLKLGLKPRPDSNYRLIIKRTQQFSHTEYRLLITFVREIAKIAEASQQDYFPTLIAALPEHVIAQSMGWPLTDVVLACIQQFSQWSMQKYEGQPITAAAGVLPTPYISRTAGVPIESIWSNDFGKVLTNGNDTMLVLSGTGRRAIEYIKVDCPAAPGYVPFRFGGLAKWAIDGRISVALNRAGEILVFGQGRLLYARRRGAWTYFSHDAIVTQMRLPWTRKIREAVYESCLDASFARTGACVGIVAKTNSDRIRDFVDDADLLAAPCSPKSQALSYLIGKRPFHQMDRQVRQELLAVDGATLIDHDGKVLAVGAILKIKAGSRGGGRLAAAITLAGLGLGIKVSQDGGITGFSGGPNKPLTEAFQLGRI